MNNTFITIVLVFSLFLIVVFLTNTTTIHAQQQMPSSSNAQPQKIPSPSSPSSPSASPKAVKITSPTKGQQIPVGKDLTIYGTSIDDATSNCQVSMSVNHVKPYQPATAAGTGGANDYSKWNFVLTSNYTTIKPGPDNRITAKYTCTDNPVMVPSHSSVNVTGIVATAAAPTTAYTLQQQTPKTSSNNTTTITNSVNKAPVSIPTNTPDSSKLLYLGINSKSANKADDANTKTVAHPTSSASTSSSSSDNVGNKIKVHKVSDSSSDSSSVSRTSSSSSDNVGNKIKVHKLHPVAHSQPSTNIDHTNIDSVPPLISDNTFIHPHQFFQPHPFFQHTHSSNKVHKFSDSSSTGSASISDHVTSKVHDSKDDNNYSNGPADNIIKDVENNLKEAGINIDLG